MLTNLNTNAYIFAWDQQGIESIIPITEYEEWDRDNTMRILKNEPTERNPLWSILQNLILRAKANGQRHYEIYSIDCAFAIDEQEWRDIWATDPQGTADLIRNRGVKVYSDREDRSRQLIS